MASLQVSLSDEMRSFIEDQVREGSYQDQSEYVRDLIRHDQERKAREQVDALLLEGLKSGEASPLTSEDWQGIRQQVRVRAAGRLEPGG